MTPLYITVDLAWDITGGFSIILYFGEFNFVHSFMGFAIQSHEKQQKF